MKNVSMRVKVVLRTRDAFFALAAILAVLFTNPATAAPASGYWWNPAEAGRGFVIETQGNTLFMAGFLYDTSGKTTWVASLGPMTSSTQYSGDMITYSGGQTLTGAYKSATLAPKLGTLSITFTDSTHGSLTWTGGGTIPIQRFDFGPGGAAATQAAGTQQAGWWWSSTEGGRGYAIEVQGGFMYLAGYMYDASGKPVWYLASGNMTGTTLFQGQWQQFGNGQTLGGVYKAPIVANGTAGNLTIQFSTTRAATLTLPDGRQISFTRFAFGGPTLFAFSPANAAPASLLTLSGSNIDTTATLSLTVFDDSGFSVNIPFASVSDTSLKASVPPYFIAATGAFASGVVKLKATQSISGAALDSNTLTGFNIQKLASVPGTPGSSTLSLIRANLAEAQRLQTAIVGTAQDTPAVNAAIAKQVTNLQTLVTNVQKVVQNGLSFTLGVVGGVNITVTSANIGDVDSLILATLQSLASPGGGSAEKGPDAGGATCMSAEASAYAQAMLAGSSNLDALARALVAAPGNSAACGTVAAFTSAYQIFGGAGGAGLGITNGVGVNPFRLPGAALFSTTAQNADSALGLNALISPALAGQGSSIKSAIAGVTSLSKATSDALLARASGDLATNLTDAQTLITTVAPPLPAGFPSGLPAGNYTISFSYCYSAPGIPNTCYADTSVASLTNADASAIAASLIDAINSSCASAGSSGCTTSYTPFDGTQFQVNFSINQSGSSFTFTYTIRKTG